MRRRTSVDGDFASRNRRTASRSCSCSSEKAKFTVGPRLYWDRWRERYRTGRAPTQAAGPGPSRIGKGRRYPDPLPRPAHYETPTVRIQKLIVGPFENNVFVVRCTGTGEA